MSIYEETICDDCRGARLCRRMDGGIETAWICEDCQQAQQLMAKAILDAEFDNMRYRLTPKGEQALAEMGGVG